MGEGQRSSSVWPILITCFLIAFFDGLDTNAITFTAPVLAAEWGIPAAAMAPAFLATSIGAVIGYMACGPMTLRIGARATATLSVMLFALGTLATILAPSIAPLAAIRFITALGLGGALPLAITAAVASVAPSRAGTTTVLVTTGLTAGGVFGGITGAPLMAHFGWQSVFVLGAVPPILLLPFVFRYVRQDVQRGTGRATQGLVSALFRDGLAARTLPLWAFACLVFVVSYAILFWLPTLLLAEGLAREMAPLGAAAFSFGGFLGNLAFLAVIGRMRAEKVLGIAVTVAMLALVAFGLDLLPAKLVLPLVAVIGFGAIPCCVGQSAIAIACYPPELRTTGVGYAAAAGRIGSIFGPGLGGLFLALGWTPQAILAALLLPFAAALLSLAVLGRQPGQVEPHAAAVPAAH